LLPACACLFWSALPTLLLLLLGELLSVVEVLELPALEGLEVAPVDVLLDVEGVVAVVPACASAVPAIPVTRPMVMAPAAAAATLPMIVAWVRRFMATTIAVGGSGRHHDNVKASSTLAG
jgi:hypothetical protein